MITAIIICVLIGYFVYKLADKQEKKVERKLQKTAKQEKATIASLPDIHFEAREMTTAQKALNLNLGDKYLLQTFEYKKNGRTIFLKMKNGDSIFGPLSEAEVRFERWGKENHNVYIQIGQKTFSFSTMAFIFPDKEWEVILHMLSLAGKAHNISAIQPINKNIDRALTVMKILKYLN